MKNLWDYIPESANYIVAAKKQIEEAAVQQKKEELPIQSNNIQ